MFRNNPVGAVLLVACGIIAIVLMWQIITGNRLSYDGPTWIVWALGAILIGGSLYGLFQGRIRKQSQQWPNPGAGQRSLWDRIRGRNKSG